VTGRLAIAIVMVLSACADEAVDPITRIVSPRVLAITTNPSALPLDGEIELFAVTVDAEGPRSGERPVEGVRMRACAPWLFVSDPARDCSGASSLSIEPDAAGRFVTPAAVLPATTTSGSPSRS